jgi:hypothetical protein
MALGDSQQHSAAIFRVSSTNAGCSEELKSHTEGDRSALEHRHLTFRCPYGAKNTLTLRLSILSLLAFEHIAIENTDNS